jgi:oligoribonuclease NrnB/cAMP/cGMP phosphodiesterase (DHH superfamily)
MKIYHLSHTDLDGFSCQYLVSLFFEDACYYNSNYGSEIIANIEKIVTDIKNQKEKDIFILITDLNLTIENCQYLENCVNNLSSDYNIKLQLLDHHATGKDASDEFSWYFLDNNRSATKITYDYLCENYKPLIETKNVDKFVNAVNAIDIWLEDEVENFEFGKVCNRAMLESRELSKFVFPIEATNYKFFMIDNCIKYLSFEKPNINLDENIYFLKKEFLRNGLEDDTIDNLSSRYVVTLLEDKKDMLTVEYNGHKGLLTFNVGNISVLANLFLKRNANYDFFLDVGFRGTVSLRADGKIDVSKLSKDKFGGGGHKNASGGRISSFEDIYMYDDVKDIIKGILSE